MNVLAICAYDANRSCCFQYATLFHLAADRGAEVRLKLSCPLLRSPNRLNSSRQTSSQYFQSRRTDLSSCHKGARGTRLQCSAGPAARQAVAARRAPRGLDQDQARRYCLLPQTRVIPIIRLVRLLGELHNDLILLTSFCLARSTCSSLIHFKSISVFGFNYNTRFCSKRVS